MQPNEHKKMKISDLPLPVRIILAIIVALLVWNLTASWRTNPPSKTPCVMLFNTQTGQQLNPDCKPQ